MGPTALTLLAAIAGDADDDVLRKLGRYLMETQLGSGKFDPLASDLGSPRRSKWGPGQAVLALVRMHKRFGGREYLEAAKRGAMYIVEDREEEEGFVLDHWFVQAVEELDPYHHDLAYVELANRIADRLASFVIPLGDETYPDWAGGFSSWGQEPPGAASLGSFEAIVSAYSLSKARGEPRENLRKAAEGCARFALRLQYRDDNTFYLKAPEKALGGFRQGMASPRIRIDGVQHAALGLMRFRRVLLDEKP